jgi:hypothetical protein
MADIKRIRLTRSLILNGGEHSEKGEVHDAPTSLAHRLVGEGSAEYVEAEEQPTSVNRMVAPGHADPRTRRVSRGPGARIHGSESYAEMQKRVEREGKERGRDSGSDSGKGSDDQDGNKDDSGDDAGDDESKGKGKGKGQDKK